jgi:hypothetical protein
MRTIFLRTQEADDKAQCLLDAIRKPSNSFGAQRFEVDASLFAAVPRSPFAYWIGDNLRRLFAELPAFEIGGRAARQGGVNGDDFRWLRLWTESPLAPVHGRFAPIAKGGKYSPFYADLLLEACWDPARGTFWAFTGLPHRPSLKPASFDFYFRPGLTWPRRTQGGLSLRAMPAGCVFADKGPAAFVKGDSQEDLLALLAIVNARAFHALVEAQMAFGSYEVGVIQRTPVPNLTASDTAVLADLARRAWSLRRSLDARNEISHAFMLPALLQVRGETLDARNGAWLEHVKSIEVELKKTQANIDDRCFELYGLSEADRRGIVAGFEVSGGVDDVGGTELEPEVNEEDDESDCADAASLGRELLSWAVGVAFGRFDVRLATGALPVPKEPEPFDPLPRSSPAMLTGGDGLPPVDTPDNYPIVLAENGILVDDFGHPRDITTAVRTVFDEVFKGDSDFWWNEVAARTDSSSQDISYWLRNGYFEHNLKQYSKSRRKAPIMWQLAVPSSRYSVWLYAHRIGRDTFIIIQNDILTPKLAHEERLLATLVMDSNADSSTSARKKIDDQESLVEELREMLDEVKRVAPLWSPSVDDGVALTMAPLWRLVPQHKIWRKEIRSKWNDLVAGKYDWSHLAMHLWPERVIPKCATDRSLAIAHGLQEIFWFEGDDGRWESFEKPKRSIDALVHERTSTAVKAALKSLLEAAEAASVTKRTRRSKAA